MYRYRYNHPAQELVARRSLHNVVTLLSCTLPSRKLQFWLVTVTRRRKAFAPCWFDSHITIPQNRRAPRNLLRARLLARRARNHPGRSEFVPDLISLPAAAPGSCPPACGF